MCGRSEQIVDWMCCSRDWMFSLNWGFSSWIGYGTCIVSKGYWMQWIRDLGMVVWLKRQRGFWNWDWHALTPLQVRDQRCKLLFRSYQVQCMCLMFHLSSQLLCGQLWIFQALQVTSQHKLQQLSTHPWAVTHILCMFNSLIATLWSKTTWSPLWKQPFLFLFVFCVYVGQPFH